MQWKSAPTQLNIAKALSPICRSQGRLQVTEIDVEGGGFPWKVRIKPERVVTISWNGAERNGTEYGLKCGTELV